MTIPQRIVDEIEERYHLIRKDYLDAFKQEHWAWFLFPLMDEPQDIVALLSDRYFQKYYDEFLGVMEHVVADDGLEGLGTYLGRGDVQKLRRHIELFEPVAQKLGMGETVRRYGVLTGRVVPNSFPARRWVAPKKITMDYPFLSELKKWTC